MPVPRSSSDAAHRAAVYCWLEPQTATASPANGHRAELTAQEQLARQRAAALGLTIAPRHVFADRRPPAVPPTTTNSSSTSSTSTNSSSGNSTSVNPTPHPTPARTATAHPNPGWTALLAALRAKEFQHVFLHQAERLESHPFALAELLTLATEHRLRLHGHPHDLNDQAVRAELLRTAERACRTARETSERARRAHRQAAADGRTHGGGLRRFGYTPGLTAVVEHEAQVVRELFARFLAGESLRSLAVDLNDRQIPTAYGNKWTVSGVGRLLEAPRYAGLRVLDGTVVRAPDGSYVTADWPACVSVDDWEAAQHLRAARAREQAATRRPRREYPLTSLLRCTRCERHMVGSMIGSYPTYACTSNSSLEAVHCSRHIGAESLEAHVAEHAISLLEALPVDALPSGALPSVPLPSGALFLDTLDGVRTGPQARHGWARLSPTRRAAVYRYFFAAIRISASSTSRSVFDPTRIEIVPHRQDTEHST
ncbi:recombinase family protein [Kitasatospora azatica]|uniref:recombinase family protein n=1 Tax=Kitasatospora azatica TaxID=58347 RepID=UPI00055BD8DA|nr:recombinase family protein [Kitasatospora azatica]